MKQQIVHAIATFVTNCVLVVLFTLSAAYWLKTGWDILLPTRSITYQKALHITFCVSLFTFTLRTADRALQGLFRKDRS